MSRGLLSFIEVEITGKLPMSMPPLPFYQAIEDLVLYFIEFWSVNEYLSSAGNSLDSSNIFMAALNAS
jgi:hypothetical protein